MIALLFGLVVCFAGYRLFLILLPIWGFFFGFGLGAQSIQALFGDAFLATITSWVVGFIVAAVFAMLAYLFYIFAVALISFSLGYAATVGVLTAIGMPLWGLHRLALAVVVGVVLALVVLRFNIQKIGDRIGHGLPGRGRHRRACSWRCSAACPRQSWCRIRWR